jgi:non-canonical (house-cleaning) NTP pyrophosphatase
MNTENVNIFITSKNQSKYEAVMTAFGRYFERLHITQPTDDIDTGSSQPFEWKGIIESAHIRLEKVPKDAPYDYIVALEAGILCSVETIGAFDFSLCAIRDQKSDILYHGFSPGFTVPTAVMKLVKPETTEKAMELATAFNKVYGLDAKARGGVIGPLTKQQFRRTDFDFAAVVMALWPIVFSDHAQNA